MKTGSRLLPLFEEGLCLAAIVKIDDHSQSSNVSGKVWPRLISTKKSGFTPKSR